MIGSSTKIARREFLALGLGAAAAGLAACSSGGSKGSYDDGYSAGYAAGLEAGKAEAESSAKAEAEAAESSIPASGIEYTINKASLAAEKYALRGTGVAIVLEVMAKNVSDEVQSAFFTGNAMSAYQDGKALGQASDVEGYEYVSGTEIKPGVTLDGWIAYELLDETTPVEIEADTTSSVNGQPYYGLANPQTIDPTTL
ncbi:DUF5067 domain-containing protein [Paratractidigestivibacter sp.]|uniref:DUF5067 domain-containing protein n=1 Tax=Paratractidigestivibacter sp. TaxID=2847316 RepID=UPI002AC8B6E7|nr:DUF5067 domain-containing protein [Paratractidigestivibacter sp.]